MAARAARSVACVPGKRELSAGHQARAGERESEILRSSGIILAWVWDGPGAFAKEPINFPSFHGLPMGLPSNQSIS